MDSLEYHAEQLDETFSNLKINTKDSVDSDVLSGSLCSTKLAKAVRNSIPLADLKSKGVFFTGDQLAHEAATSIAQDLDLTSRVLDPACGSGNLLLAITKYLPICSSLRETLITWGQVLYGFEIDSGFVKLAKKRIVLEAINRGAGIDISSLKEAEALLLNIKRRNGLTKTISADIFTHIIMNPPYNSRANTENPLWQKKCLVNSAAIFCYKYLSNCKEGTKFVAILPEVLRSGNRYVNWRAYISSKISGSIELRGRFDTKANVDIFLLSGIASSDTEEEVIWNKHLQDEDSEVLENHFNVSVGPLVAYRDEKKGVKAPFIYPKNIEPWCKVSPRLEYRLFSGKLIKPPFVVIRRTSSPRDKVRAVASVITGKEKVAVENHFIVCVPKTGKVSDCMKLMEACKQSSTNDYLNDYIRCRHLTVSSIKSMPIYMR